MGENCTPAEGQALSQPSRLNLEPLEPRLLLSAGALDLTFGVGGLVTTDLGSQKDFGWGCASAIQADGKIVVAGDSDQGATCTDFALARYNPDGSLDTSFDGDGLVTTDFASWYDHAYGVAIQADGKIVVAGESGGDFALARYNADGSLDTTFDGDGKVVTDLGSSMDTAWDVAIQADGKIVVAGLSVQGSTGVDLALARYNADGSLDTTFDGDGLVTTDFGGLEGYCYGVAIQADGKIVVAGGVGELSTGWDFALARYDTDGSLDSSFDGDGKLVTDFGQPSFAYDLAMQSDGKIVVAGATAQPSGYSDFALARYNTDGSLDTTFDGDGKVITDLGSSSDVAWDVAIQSDGRIVAAGHSDQPGTGLDIALARYLGDSDTTPPVVEGVDVGADLQSLIVRFNDDDLNATRATDLTNCVLIAANGDADSDGNPFNDGDEVQLSLSSMMYDSAADQITIQTSGVLFDDFFRLEMDGDDAVGDGTSGITDLAGNYLAGGDYAVELDLTALSAVDELLDDLETLGLSTNAESSLSGKLEAAIHLLDQDVGSDRSLQALMDAFIKGVNHWYEKGQIAEEDRNDLVWEAEQILFGLELVSA